MRSPELKMNPVNILWTGGWDSTYRLCELLVIHRRVVQPHYIVDPERKSLRFEFIAQEKIKDLLFRLFPETRKLLLDTIISVRNDTPINDSLKQSSLFLKKEVKFGSQYEWLARYCQTKSISNLELCFEHDPNASKNKYLKAYIIPKEPSEFKTFIVDPTSKNTAVLDLLQFYEWPLWQVTRKMMFQDSIKMGIIDIMNLTWFCHTPIKGKPCGLCVPCNDAMFYGFSYRFTTLGKLRYNVRIISKRELTTKLSILSRRGSKK